jgi:hypothetical protein
MWPGLGATSYPLLQAGSTVGRVIPLPHLCASLAYYGQLYVYILMYMTSIYVLQLHRILTLSLIYWTDVTSDIKGHILYA